MVGLKLYNSILADIEDVMDSGDTVIKNMTSIGGKLELFDIFGCGKCKLNTISELKLKENTSNIQPFNKEKLEDLIDNYMFNHKHNSIFKFIYNKLNTSIINKLYMLITYIENIEISDLNIDFNKQEVQNAFCKELTYDLMENGIIKGGYFLPYDTCNKNVYGLCYVEPTMSVNAIYILFKIKQ